MNKALPIGHNWLTGFRPLLRPKCELPDRATCLSVADPSTGIAAPRLRDLRCGDGQMELDLIHFRHVKILRAFEASRRSDYENASSFDCQI
jgi:hypothetical protein